MMRSNDSSTSDQSALTDLMEQQKGSIAVLKDRLNVMAGVVMAAQVIRDAYKDKGPIPYGYTLVERLDALARAKET